MSKEIALNTVLFEFKNGLIDKEHCMEELEQIFQLHGVEPAEGTSEFKSGVEIIAEERLRHLTEEGWTPEHDDSHTDGELAEAGAAYAASCNLATMVISGETGKEIEVTVLRNTRWPFAKKWWKPTPNDRIKELGKAGSFIAAEIDRLQRKKLRDGGN